MNQKQKPMNQMTAIKTHLKKYKKITSMQAFELYGCTRLSSKIFDLRKAGWVIDSVPTQGTTRYGESTIYSTYRYVSAPDTKKKGK